ncbi:MAG: hypothetical protein ABI822_14740 [Bryobacteraceae bacterium]
MVDNAQKPEESPFAEFQSEEYANGEPVAAEVAAEAAVGADGSAEPVKEEATQLAAEGEQSVTGEKGEDPPKKTAQERINEITRARREAERATETEKRRADAAEQRARDLETRLNAPPKKDEAAKKADVEDDPTAPKPDDYEYGELDSRYIRAIAGHEAERKFAELRSADTQEREQRALQEKQSAAREQFEVMISSGAKKHEDFYEKVVIGSESGSWPLSETLGELIMESDAGNDIAYHLATNPEEADRVYRSSPVEQARYFGRMESKFSAGQAAASGDASGKSAPRTPKAPPPVDTARGAGGQFHATADTDDFAAFEARATTKG